MTFSFDPTLAADLDKVRFYVGDTVDAGHLVENETITALLASISNPVRTASAIARSVASRFARQVDKAIGTTRLSLGQRFEHWKELAAQLEAMGGTFDGTGVPTIGGPYVGGISEAERTDLAVGNTDRIQPSFAVSKDDNPTYAAPTPPYNPFR